MDPMLSGIKGSGRFMSDLEPSERLQMANSLLAVAVTREHTLASRIQPENPLLQLP